MANLFNGTQYSLTTSSLCWGHPMTLSAWGRNTSVGTARSHSYVGTLPSSVRNGNFVGQTNIAQHRAAAMSFTGTQVTVASAIGGSVVQSQWQNTVGIFPSLSSRTVYVDGVNFGSSGSTQGSFTSDAVIGIGASTSTTSWANFWVGDLAEIGVWDVILTAGEIASLSKGMSCRRIRPQSLKFYAPLVRSQVDLRGGLTLTQYVNGAPPTISTPSPSNHLRIYA